MSNIYRKYRTTGNLVNIALLAMVLLPLLVLSYFNHPSVADDYCYIDTAFKYGWFEAMNYYYSGWTGRYFGILLNHSNPLLFHSIISFKVLPILLLLFVMYSLYLLGKNLTPTLSRLANVGFAGIIFFLYVLRMASINEAFYWMASFVTYTVPNSLTLIWIVLTLRWYRQDSAGLKFWMGLLGCLIVAAVIGSSETNLMVILMLIASWWLQMVLNKKKVDGYMVATLVVALVSCFALFLAPGNAIRLAGNPMGGDLIFSLISSFKKLGMLIYEWVFTTPLLVFTVLWLAILKKVSVKARKYFDVPIWFVSLLYLGVVSSQLFPSYYGIGIEPTPRVINSVYFFFLTGWFYLAGVLFHRLKWMNLQVLQSSRARFVLLCGITLLSVSASLYKSNNVKGIFSDLLKGRARAFDKENYARYALLENSKEPVVYLPPIQSKPYTLFSDDIKSDPNHWWNKCLAGYYGKDSVYLAK